MSRENLYYGSGNSNNATYTYDYDKWGNLLTKKRYAYIPPENQLSGTVIETNTYGYSNTQWADLLTSYNGQSITYDNMGNPTSYLGKTLEWEGKKLVSAQIPVTAGRLKTAEYAYNEDGLRLSKVYDGTTTEYYYNGSVLIGMKIGTGSTAKILCFSYDASGNVIAVDYSENNGSTFNSYFYLRNAQNDIVKILDNTGTTVVEYIYDSWGKIISSTGSLTTTLGTDQPFRYRGYVYDTETQLYYLQSRYYDPSTCRFISADVYLSTGQGVIGHNSFAYCNNNPMSFSDPDGYFPGMLNVAVMKSDEGGGLGNSRGGVVYTQDTAKRLIDEIFIHEGYSKVYIEFTGAGAHIYNSYLVETEAIRMEVCRILEHTEGFQRTAESLCAEWKVHNDVYNSCLALISNFKARAKDVDLDYVKDSNWYVNFTTSIYEYFGIQ